MQAELDRQSPDFEFCEGTPNYRFPLYDFPYPISLGARLAIKSTQFVAPARFNLTSGVLEAHQKAHSLNSSQIAFCELHSDGAARDRAVPVGGGSTMIVELYDRRTMASMEVALEKACEHWPCGGTHNLRKRVAQAIIRCAKTGNTSLDALTSAAQHAAAQLSRSRRASAKPKGADVRPKWQDAA